MKKYEGVVRNRDGDAISGAEVYIYTSGTSSLVSLFSDDGVTATTNPLSTDSDGYFAAFTADATLRVKIVVDGDTLADRSNIQHYDAQDNEIKALRSVTSAADKGFYFTGSGTGAVFDLTSGGRALGGLSSAADKLPYFTGSGTASTADFTAAGRALVDDASASAQRTTLGLGTIAILDEATTAQVRSNTADKALSTDQTWAAADYVALTDAATVDVDMSAGINFSLTIGGNRTLGAPTNTKNGQAGEIIITQDGTGSRTLAYHANWKFVGGADPTLSTDAGAVDVLSYKVVNSTFIIASLSKGFA